MNAFVWLLQGLLAFTFLFAGALKVLRPKEKVIAVPVMRWTAPLSGLQIKLIGAAQILGSLALVEPWATGILPVLTPVTAACFALFMGGAVVVRARATGLRALLPLTLAVMSAIVALARFKTLGWGTGA
jgi:hypothetical protein